jgi:hypothetical protein
LIPAKSGAATKSALIGSFSSKTGKNRAPMIIKPICEPLPGTGTRSSCASMPSSRSRCANAGRSESGIDSPLRLLPCGPKRRLLRSLLQEIPNCVRQEFHCAFRCEMEFGRKLLNQVRSAPDNIPRDFSSIETLWLRPLRNACTNGGCQRLKIHHCPFVAAGLGDPKKYFASRGTLHLGQCQPVSNLSFVARPFKFVPHPLQRGQAALGLPSYPKTTSFAISLSLRYQLRLLLPSLHTGRGCFLRYRRALRRCHCFQPTLTTSAAHLPHHLGDLIFVHPL